MNSMFVPGAWWPVSTSTLALLAEAEAVHERRAPVGHVHRVEAGLEELVLEQHPHAVGQRRVDLAKRLGQAVLARRDVVLAGVVGAVGEPQAEARRAGRLRDLDALERWPVAFRRTAGSGLHTLPSRYSSSWKTFGLMAPIRSPASAACLASLP